MRRIDDKMAKAKRKRYEYQVKGKREWNHIPAMFLRVLDKKLAEESTIKSIDSGETFTTSDGKKVRLQKK